MKEQQAFFLLNLGRREAAYGTPITPLETWYRFIEGNLLKRSLGVVDDANEVRGTQYPTKDSDLKIRESVKGPFRFRLNTELFAYFVGAALGNVDTTGSGPYTHVFTPPTPATNSPWSITAVQAQDRTDTATFKEYAGLVVNDLGFSIGPDFGVIECDGNLMSDGGETAVPSTTPPDIATALEGSRVVSNNLTVKFGATPDSVNTLFRSVNVRLNCNLVGVPNAASGLKFGAVYYSNGPNPELQVELVLKGRVGDTFYAAQQNQTALKFELALVRDANHEIKIESDAVKIDPEAEIIDYDETGQILRMPLKFQYDVTAGLPWKITVKNQLAALLAAS